MRELIFSFEYNGKPLKDFCKRNDGSLWFFCGNWIVGWRIGEKEGRPISNIQGKNDGSLEQRYSGGIERWSDLDTFCSRVGRTYQWIRYR